MKQYLELLGELQDATVKDNRTGIPTAAKFAHQMSFNLAQRFPAITTKQLYMKSLIGELICFLRGATDNAEFEALKCNIWSANANKHGTDIHGNHVDNKWLSNPFRKGHNDLGRIYGAQWRNWDHTTYLSTEELESMYETYLNTKEDEDDVVHDGTKLVESLGYEALGPLQNDRDLHVFRKKVDQLKWAIDQLINNPTNRRVLISGWNPGDLDKMALPPCHVLQHWQCMPMSTLDRIEHHRQDKFERTLAEIEKAIEANKDKDDFWLRHVNPTMEAMSRIDEDLINTGYDQGTEEFEEALDDLGVPRYKLNLLMYQRSADSVLGIPFNIASYAVMVAIMCRITGHAEGMFHYVTGDTHIYGNHEEAVKEQLARTPIENPVRLKIAPHLKTLDDFEKATPDDFELVGYEHHGPLKNETPMAV